MKRSDTLPTNRPIHQYTSNTKPISRTNTSHYQPSNPRSSTNNDPSTFRPSLPVRENTDYVSMLLALDTIPRLHNIFASFFTWLLLAGFLIFPGTFTSLSDLSPTSTTETLIIRSVKHIPLLILASICTFIGASGMIWMWYRHHGNYIWLLNRIFLPGCLNSIAGVIDTLVTVYAQNGGHWSPTATVTAGVTGGVAVITGVLFGVYDFWGLEGVKKRHKRQVVLGEETRLEKMQRLANEPGIGGMDSVV